MNFPFPIRIALGLALWLGLWAGCTSRPEARLFNVRDFGATGQKSQDAGPALQRAMDACAAAGGGTVLVPPGDYTSGTVFLRSGVRLEIAAGATVFASTNPAAYRYGNIPSKAALFFGEKVENVAIVGAGTVDGQAEYEWREDDFEKGFSHKELMMQMGKSLRRSFPKGLKEGAIYPHLVWIGESRQVRFEGLRWLRSPSWSLAFYGCENLSFYRLYVHTSLEEGVWADGIDLDGCRNVRLENCRIATGDDCVVFISTDVWGPARPCENILVRNCTLSSASAGVKFSEGNRAGIRRVEVRDCLLTNVNRGIVAYAMLGGEVSDVLLSNLTIHCRRYDWFWAGDGQPFHFRVGRVSEFTKQPAKPDEPAPGRIHGITVRDVRARAWGTSRLLGHAEGRIEDLVFDNVRLEMATDPGAPFDTADHALELKHARQVHLRGLSIYWRSPALPSWSSALACAEVTDLRLEKFHGRAGSGNRDVPAISLHQVENARLQLPAGASLQAGLIRVTGDRSRNIQLSEEGGPEGVPLARSVWLPEEFPDADFLAGFPRPGRP